MTEFTKPSTGIQTLFPGSGREQPRPREVTDVVHLTHPFPSQASDLQTTARSSFTSAGAVTPVLVTPDVPDGFFDEWTLGHVGHTSAAGTLPVLRLSLIDPAGAALVLGRWHFDSNVNTFMPLFAGAVFVNNAFASPSQLITPVRPMLVPPGWHLQLDGSTQAVAFTVTLAGLVIRRSLADVPLHRG